MYTNCAAWLASVLKTAVDVRYRPLRLATRHRRCRLTDTLRVSKRKWSVCSLGGIAAQSITTANAPRGEEERATMEDLVEFSAYLSDRQRGGPTRPQLHGGTGKEVVDWMISTYGSSNLFVELQRNFIREAEQRKQATHKPAPSPHLPLVAACAFARETAGVFVVASTMG
jgi:hypothetical protein